jgi:putative MATE family efflux protein
MDQTFMKKKKIFPLVLSMALPMVLSMAFNSLYNIVDSYFVAKLSEDAMTALSLVFPAQNLMTSIGVGFGVGMNAMIAFYLGAQQQEKANRAATQGLVLSAVHGILLMVVCLIAMPAFLGAFTRNENVIQLGLDYANIVFVFAVAVTLGIAYEKIFQAVGRMKETMFCMVVGFVTNIVLDPLLIFGIGCFPRMGIRGAAVATGAGQILTLLAYVILDRVKPLPVAISRKSLGFNRDIWAKMYGIGIPASLNMALPSLLISALNGILAAYSQTYVLVLGVYYKLQTFIYLPANGIIQGIRPLIGYNYGAGEKKRVEKIYQLTMVLTMGIMALGTVCCWLLPGQLIGLFTDNPDTITIGVTALHVISLGFVVSAVSVTCAGALEALGEGMPSLVVSLMRYVVVIIPTAYLLSRKVGVTGVWWAFVITEMTAAFVSFFLYRRIWRRAYKKL